MRNKESSARLRWDKYTRGIVVENLMLMKAMDAPAPEYRATVKAKILSQLAGKPARPEKCGKVRDRFLRRARRVSKYPARGRWELLAYKDGPTRTVRRKYRKSSSFWPAPESARNSAQTDNLCH